MKVPSGRGRVDAAFVVADVKELMKRCGMKVSSHCSNTI